MLNNTRMHFVYAMAFTLFTGIVQGSEAQIGAFAGPVSGLKYETPTTSGVTNEQGEFAYLAGETVTFSVGDVVLGTVEGAPRINEAHLNSRVNGNIDKLKDPELTNMVRLLHSLDQDGLPENGVQIAEKTHSVVGDRGFSFGMQSSGNRSPLVSEEAFAADPLVTSLMADMNSTDGVFTTDSPRGLVSGAQARNQVRRNIRGIVKMTDVKIPMRDGSFLYADVFRPADDGQYPIVMNLGVYGKAFNRECICNAEDFLAKEVLEDDFFHGNPDGAIYENHEAVDSSVWVPENYIAIRVDSRGTCRSPGQIEIFSVQEAQDFYDAIEWSAKQPWSNGNVGLWGMSYYAINQHAVAALQPPGLKAIIPTATDINSYEELLYSGGIRNEEMVVGWWDHTKHAVCGELNAKNWLEILAANPFYSEEIYGPKGEILTSPDVSKIEVAQWVHASTTHDGHIHVRGSNEAHTRSASKHKKLDIVTNWFVNNYNAVPDHMRFFDYWLKGIDNGIMDEPPVRVRIRTGKGGYYTMYENEWPIARTDYRKYYLDTTASEWKGNGLRDDFMRLTSQPPSEEGRVSYSAEVDVGSIYPRELGTTACWATGKSFVTEPMSEDMVLAGFMKLGLWVSSTSSDMDIYASVRVLDENGQEVSYSGAPDLDDLTNIYPVGIGWLKVSHRKLDESRASHYQPVHTHLESDYAPLKNNEAVPVEVEIWPSTALIRKGHRVRLDIQPHDGCGHGSRHTYDPSYHTNAENTLYGGPDHVSYLQLPIIPAKPETVSARKN